MAKSSRPKCSCDEKTKRVLINVSVVGSAGPLRMLVNEGDSVSRIIHHVLKLYSWEGRLPVLGSDRDQFLLYCHDSVGCYVALDAFESIGSTGSRSFLMAPKKPQPLDSKKSRAPAARFKSWPKKLGVKITRWVK